MRRPVVLVILCLLILSASLTAAGDTTLRASEKLGWQLGVQAWSFNSLTFFEALEKTQAIGLKYIEAFPGQKVSRDMPDVTMGPGLTKAQMAKIKNKLDKVLEGLVE